MNMLETAGVNDPDDKYGGAIVVGAVSGALINVLLV